MILTAVALLIGSTLIGTAGTAALFEYFVRRQQSLRPDVSESHTHASAGL